MFFACFVIMAAFLFAGCNNVFSPYSPQPGGDGMGNVAVSFSAGSAGRTLLPSILDFDLYEFTFLNGNSEEFFFTEENGLGVSATFAVPSGTGYSLNVKAYKGSGSGKILAAQGDSASFEVNASAITPVTVILTGNLSGGSSGTFSYHIRYPLNAGIARMALIRGSSEINLLAGAAETTNGDVKATAYSAAVPAGWYGLEVDLVNGEMVAFDEDIVQIYSDTTTFYGTALEPIVFTGADFKNLAASENEGETVETFEIPGYVFDVSGNGNEGSIPGGGAVGTMYETYTNSNGTYDDVLELAPPTLEGYVWEPDMGCYIMTLRIPSTGFYKLSVDVMVEVIPHEGVYICWEKTSDLYQEIAGSKVRGYPAIFEPGVWKNFSTEVPEGVYFEEGDVIGLLAQHNVAEDQGGTYLWGEVGLNGATVYLKNIDLVKVDGSYGDELNIYPSSFELFSRGTRQLVVSGNASGGILTWTSSDASVVKVDQTGFVTAGKVEDATSATITVTGDSGTAEANVTVLPSNKYIALTFDDGPDPGAGATPKLLDILDEKDVPVTFFFVGARVNEHQSLAQRAAAKHEIGNHSYNHRFADFNEGDISYSPKDIAYYVDEFLRTQEIIEEVTGKAPVIVRPPNLNSHNNLRAAATALGLPLIHAYGFNDWEPGYSSENIYNGAMATTAPWRILLFHDYYGGSPMQDGWVGNGENTINAMAGIIDALHNQGYELVTVSEMLAKKEALYLDLGYPYVDFDSVTEDQDFPADGVIVPVSGIAVSETSITLDAGYNRTILPTVLPSNATHNKVYWYSTDDRIASVSAVGVISARTPGTTTITARAEHKTAKITVTVNAGTGGDGGTLLGPYAEWRGFVVRGPAGEEANPVATHYNTFEAYSDVIKLEPPNDGYEKATTMLAYTIPQNGNYKISMWVKVVKNNPSDPVYLCWEQTDDPWGILAGSYWPGNPAPVTEGEWFHLYTDDPAGLSLQTGEVIAFLAQNNADNPLWDKVGLNNATIYVRDLVLEKIGGGTGTGTGTATTWDAFDIPGNFAVEKAGANISGAVYATGDFKGYSNVLKLELPNNGSYPPLVGLDPAYVAMLYELPNSGFYRLSMQVYVEKRNDPDVTIAWEINKDPWLVAGDLNTVPLGEWLPVGGKETDWFTIGDDDYKSLFLIALHREGHGLKDAAVYIRDMKLEWAAEPGPNIETIIDIPSTPVTGSANSGITLEWMEVGVHLSASETSRIISHGESVTITAPENLPQYQWRVDGRSVAGANSREFVFDDYVYTDAGTYLITLWAGASIGGDVITITVVE